jgi:putative ABC transport system permease protein
VNWLSDPFLLPGFVALTLFVSLMSGAYPAAVLSRFKPILALRGSAGAGGGRAWLRKSLVTFQFVISAGLIVSTLVMLRQLHYMQSTDLGLEPDQIVSINLSGSLDERFPVFKDAFQRIPNVVGVSGGEVVNGGFMIIFQDDAPVRPSEGLIRMYQTDHGYVNLLGMEIVAGNDFRETLGDSERIPVLLNQSAVEDMQLTEPIGQVITWGRDADVFYQVIGVVKDFHYGSLRQEIGPLMIRQSEAPGRVLVKISTDDVQGTLAALETAWAGIEQEAAFNYRFLDEQFERLYDGERRTGNLFSLAAAFAIFVSCLGLFGLAAYSAEQRTREIGIRKVLGATIGGIVGLLSKEFLRLVLIAFVLAAPLAWFIMDRWLEDFAYRIEIGPGIFALSAVLALTVALSSVVWQAIRAAVADPVKSIRYE